MDPLPDVVASPDSASQPLPKRRRSQANLADCCRTCRLRKVKCTGNPGNAKQCVNCSRLDLACSFNTHQDVSQDPSSRSKPSRSHTEAGTLRKRAQRACTQCHTHKTRCSGDLPSCARCTAGHLTCEYMPTKRKFTHVPIPVKTVSAKPMSDAGEPITPRPEHPSPPSTDTSITATGSGSGPGLGPSSSCPPSSSLPDPTMLAKEDLLARKDVVLRHVDAYFKHLYYSPCFSFFHPTTTYQEIQDGEFHPSRAAAICSVAAFFVSPGQAVEFASKCSLQVEFHLFRNVGSLNEANLFLYALDIAHNLFVAKYAKCWQLLAVACRLMVGLQLNWEVPGSKKTFIQQECARRLAWHMFHMDRILAGGFEAYICCREENMKIRLPCREKAFTKDTPVLVERLNDNVPPQEVAIGLIGYQIKLLNIRHHVLTLSKQFATGPAYLQRTRWEASTVMEDVNRLQHELSSFRNSLPDDLKLSDQNISRWVWSEEQAVFIFLHSFLCTCHTDLYRFSLPGIREKGTPDLLRKLPKEFLVKCQKQAVAHAVTLARFWDAVYNEALSQNEDGKPILLGDQNLLLCVQQCTKVLITAIQHRLYLDLNAHSTAPLWRNGPVRDGSLRLLIESCLRIVEPWAKLIPSTKTQYDALVKSVKEFDRTNKYDEQSTLGTNGAKWSGPTKLPGPHYILENAYLAQKEEEERRTEPDPAIAAHWYSNQLPPDAHDPYTGVNADDSEFNSEFCPPGMPILLAEARGLPTNPLPVEAPLPFIGTPNPQMLPNGLMPMHDYAFVPEVPVASQEDVPILPASTVPDTPMFPSAAQQAHYSMAQPNLYSHQYPGEVQYLGADESANAHIHVNGYV